MKRQNGGSLKYRFVKGDITNMVADAIVLPVNEELKEDTGASSSKRHEELAIQTQKRQ